MKRFIALLLCAVLLCSFDYCAFAADQPAPIPRLSPEEIQKTPKGLHHYMLICMDSWNTRLDNLTFTDGLILVTVDEYARRVMLTSFIRDMLIERPNVPDDEGQHEADYTAGQLKDTYTFGRINYIVYKLTHATKNGKNLYSVEQAFDTLIATINSHFDLQIEKYIVVDFRQVEKIVDAIGGVDITLTASEAQYLRDYPIPAASTTPQISGAGTYHFQGKSAVIYMRIRKRATAEYLHADGTFRSDTQDIGRTYRARTVLTTIADSLKDITYEEAEKLLDVIVDCTILTNMTANDMLDALDLAMDMKGTPVESIRMPIDGTYEAMPVAGMATQQIDYIKNREALWDFLLDPFTVVEEEE